MSKKDRTLYTNDEVVACLFSFEQYIKDHYILIIQSPVGPMRINPEPGKLVEAWQAEDTGGGKA